MEKDGEGERKKETLKQNHQRTKAHKHAAQKHASHHPAKTPAHQDSSTEKHKPTPKNTTCSDKRQPNQNLIPNHKRTKRQANKNTTHRNMSGEGDSCRKKRGTEKTPQLVN